MGSRLDRISHASEDPQHGVFALAHVQESLRPLSSG
jgi:hypothetical protein